MDKMFAETYYLYHEQCSLYKPIVSLENAPLYLKLEKKKKERQVLYPTMSFTLRLTHTHTTIIRH